MSEYAFVEFVMKKVSKEIKLTNYEIERLKELLNKQCLTKSEKRKLNNKDGSDELYLLETVLKN